MKKRVLAIMMAVVLLLCQWSIALATDDTEKTINVTHSISDSTVTVKGSVSTGVKEYLKLDVVKQVDSANTEPYATTVKNGNNVCVDGKFYTDVNGKFEVSFTIDEISEERAVYKYTVSETLKQDSVKEIITENFDDGTVTSTYSNSGTFVTDPQDSTNKYYDMTGPRAGSTTVPQYLGYSVTTDKTACYSIQTDILLSETFTDECDLISTANSSSGAGDRDTTINNLSNEAYKVQAKDGALVLYCAKNNTSQTEAQTLTLLEQFEENTWYSVKIEMDCKTLGLRVWVDGIEKCTDTEKYIFAQKSYNRLFIAKIGKIIDGLSFQVDNVNVNEITKYSLNGITALTSSITVFGTNDYNNVKDAVNSATTDTISGIITNPENSTILGVDLSKYNDFEDSQKDFVDAQMVGSKPYDNCGDIKEMFDKLCIFVELKASTSAEDFADKLKSNELVLGITVPAGIYEDTDVMGCAYSNLSFADTFDKLVSLAYACVDLYKLKTIEPSDFASVEEFMKPYGWSIKLAMCSENVVSALKAASESYVFTFADTPENLLRGWVEDLNEVYVAAKIAEAEYQAIIDSKSITNNKITLTGHVESVEENELPPAGHKYIATATCDSNSYDTTFSLNDDGTFSCEIVVENASEDQDYIVTVKNVKPDPIPEQVAKIDFYGDEIFSGRGYETKVDIVTLGSEHSTVAKLTGKSDTECYIDTSSHNKISPRLIYAVNELKNTKEGLLCLEIDFMLPENTVSDIYGITNLNGKTALLVSSTYEGALVAKYYNTNLSYTTVTILDAYETNKWYSLKYEIDLATNDAELFLDDTSVAEVTLSKKDTETTDFGGFPRILFTQAFLTSSNPNSKTHYLDNFLAYFDKAERITVCEATEVVKVYGTESVQTAVNTVADASNDACITAIANNNEIFEIDFEASYNGLANKQPVWYALTELDRTATVTDIRNTLYGEVALQKMKESLTADEKVVILAENSRWIGIELSDVMVGNSVYTRLLNANVNNISDCTELRTLCDKIKVVAQMQTATVLTVSEIVDDYVELLESKGLSTKYKELKQTVRDAVATAVFKASIESTDPDTLLSNIISELNKAVNSLKEPDNNSSGSSSAGNRDNSSNEISIGILNSETSTKNTFNDVAVSHWSFEAIEYLAKRGIINGKGNGNFAPSDSVKREEFIKMVIASLGVELSSADESFEDVSPDKWYAPYVATGVNLGIVNGISENLFGIDNNISRQDAATMLYRCREALNAGLVAERDYNKFNDSAQISEYASEAVEYFYRCNVINGNENNCFAPLENLTRAQAAKMIYEIIR